MKNVLTALTLLFSIESNATDVLDLIQDSEIQYKTIASKIAILETGHFKSKFYKTTNNAFGFKKNQRGHYFSLKKGYCVYYSPKNSINDYEEWEKNVIKKHKLHTRQAFLRFISKRYSKSHNYIKKLDKIRV